ncbi:MAG TPA: c-type cytochrome, partial [Myxococcaceae bacterium]|nr:c-type cytochrome [Myxococcaceae bacterium]
MIRRPTRCSSLVLLVPLLAAAAPSSSASRGETVFQARCTLCHPVDPGEAGGQGPNLRGVVGRKAASTDFGYSPALTRWGKTWTPALLQRYLTNPGALVPGTTMVQKVKDARERADLVAYLGSRRSSKIATPLAAGVASVPGGGPDAGVPGQAVSAGAPDAGLPGGNDGVLTGAAAFGDWRTD